MAEADCQRRVFFVVYDLHVYVPVQQVQDGVEVVFAAGVVDY